MALLDEGDGPGDAPFVTAEVETAPEAVFRSWIDSRLGRTARLDVGPARPAGLGTVQLAADGFTRHSFLCGQSGSGKTYTLGLLLEQLLLHTDLKVIVLDPNSDYVRITEMDLEGLDGDALRRGEASPTSARLPPPRGQPAADPLRAAPLQQQALVLELDPIVDAEQFDALRRVVEAMPDTEYSLTDVRGPPGPAQRRRRAGWRCGSTTSARPTGRCGPAPTTGPIMDQLPEGWRAAVVDIGELPHPRERSAVVASVLRRCGSGGTSREPVLLVIDEAHNVCPAVPTDHAQALAIEHAVRIAAEGRKYGLYLFLATQRPDRLHPEVLAQCENLVLMKVNSVGRDRPAGATFSHVPRQLLELAPTFTIGQGLVAGRIAPLPTLFSSGRRRSPEGGADVPTTWLTAGAVDVRPPMT